jgi:hypothetical protein
MQAPLTSSQPRLPGSTSEARDAIYQRLLGKASALAVTDKAAGTAFDMAFQDSSIVEPFAILNSVIATGDTIAIDVQVQPPGGSPVSILAAPVVLDPTSPVGASIPLPLATGMLGALVPEGSVVLLSGTPSGASTMALVVGVSLPLNPAT